MKASERIAILRDMLVVGGILIFFLGFVYLYYYMRPFGISILASAISLQDVFVFAFRVFQNETIPISILLVLAVAAWSAHDRSHSLEAINKWPWDLFRNVLVLLLIGAGFVAAFNLAKHAAGKDLELDEQQVHTAAAEKLVLVETTDGIVHSTKDFEDLIRDVNQAGGDGRAKLVGESADRIYVYVGATPQARADVGTFLPGDHVYAIEKSAVTVQEDIQP